MSPPRARTGLARPFDRLLVANRGEVALRIARSARELGIVPLGVWSDADRDAPHLTVMAESVRIGEAPPSASYLSIERLLDAARRLRAEAVHPGYGFLAENPDFAEAVVAAGLVFVGPPAESMRALGDKARAKEVARRAGVPVIPGFEIATNDPEIAARAAQLGFPLLVKAAAGGGGRGIRLVEGAEQLRDALAAAASEAQAAFGDSRLLLERALDGARHVEVQVLADAHGRLLHLGERDCSSQRRHQKVVEEAPAPALDEELRSRLHETALRMAGAVAFLGAGTVETLVHGRDVYFLELNTRLQVEHPVTEEVLGVDLVEWQLRIARGEALRFAQKDLAPRGHAIEARLYAEDPRQGYAPRPGRAVVFRPAIGDSLRVETALRDGAEVGAFYDPMVAKLIARGADRAEALARLAEALERTVVLGLVTNRELLVDYLRSDDFARPDGGAPDTRTLPRFVDRWRAATPGGEDERCVALCALALGGLVDAWAKGLAPWSSGEPLASFVPMELGSGAAEVRIKPLERGRPFFAVSAGAGAERAAAFALEVELLAGVRTEAVGRGSLHTLDVRWSDRDASDRETVVLWVERAGPGRLPPSAHVERPARSGSARRRVATATSPGSDDGSLFAPMAGQVTQVLAARGDAVEAGETVCVLEAMKLEARVRATSAGTVAELFVRPGDHVAHRALLARIEPRG